jgi:hypothetical protein
MADGGALTVMGVTRIRMDQESKLSLDFRIRLAVA